MVDFEDLIEELLSIPPACYEGNSRTNNKGVKAANG